MPVNGLFKARWGWKSEGVSLDKSSFFLSFYVVMSYIPSNPDGPTTRKGDGLGH